jgi:hypothetical protein
VDMLPPPSARRTAVEAYPLAVEQLRAWGFTAEPAAASESRVAAAMNGLAVDHLAFVTDDLNAAAQRLEAAGARITGRREDSLRVDAQHGLVIEIVRDTDRAETYWCPMHPDVRSADAGKCPVCGMALVQIPPPRIGEYRLDVDQIRDAGRRTTGLTIAVREPDTNAAVTKFSFVHERLLHLFIVSRDLTYFAHVHPEQQADGRFVLQHPLDGGEYMLIADFVPSSGTSQLLQKAIIVSGPAASSAEPNDSPGGLTVSMAVDGELAAGKDARLTFTVRDATTGMPVSDLQPYLGAPAHMLLLRADLTDAVHAHPEEQVAAGPSVRFHPLIPAPGAYKLWVQFQHRGQVSTSTFDLVVPR